jgi:hypothetical protein
MRVLYDFPRKKMLDDLKVEEVAATLLYYTAKKHSLCYDYERVTEKSTFISRPLRKT